LLTADAGKVTDPHTARCFTYGELRAAGSVRVVSDLELLAPSRLEVGRTSIPKADGREFVTGRHQYPSDMSAKHALRAILRPSGYNATLVSLDSSAAEKIPGVKVIRDGDFVGVVAPDTFTAQRAVSALRAEWKVPAQPSNRELFKLLKDTSDAGDGRNPSRHVEQALTAAPVAWTSNTPSSSLLTRR